MKLLTLIITFLITATTVAVTEPIGKISGTVIDKELQEPIPYATIIINDMAGNLVSGNTSQDDGSFVVDKIETGEYMFQVQFIGYKTHSQKITISSNNANVDFGVIALEPELSQLDDVNIVAERSTIEQRIDRKVINVGKDLTTAGASASDIMGNLPTLTVDQDGNIAMRGNDNVRILVDGKPTNIPAAQLLKQIPSTSIKSIELITNPSAKYNPEGMSGIINIVLHKNSNLGFNGNLNTGVTFGENTRYNGSLNLNYRTGKFNFFGNLGTNFGKRPQNGLIEELPNIAKQDFFILSDNTSILYKAGVDFYLNDKNTFSFFTNQNRFTGETSGDFDVLYLNSTEPDIFQDFLFDNKNLSSTYNAVYKRLFEKEGHSLELEADFNIIDGSDTGRFDISGGGGNFASYTDNTENDIANTTLNLDYVNPLTETSKMELGAEARLRNSNSVYRSTNENIPGANFDYDNSIYSLYATYGQNLEKWSYQLGARLEQYDVEAINNGQRVYEDDYITVYPSAFASYKFTDMKTLQLSFGRRVDRPGLSQVNPVRDFSSPRITVTGNPELDPQFTNSLELNYTQNYSKGNLNAGVFYRVINNEINQTLLLDPEDPNKLILTFANGDDNSAYGAEISGSYKPFKWWSLNPSFELYTRNIKGFVGTNYLEVDNTAYNFRLNQTFNATKQLSFQLFGMYRSKAQLLQIEAQEMYFINAGARYNFLDNKATLSLNVNDIFDTQRFQFESEVPSRQRGTFKPDSQTVYLGFSYNFGGGKNTALKRKNRDDNEAQGGGLF
ncbi:TonB-dependent receptor [Antarcticibacterium arcticum]|uniref:TonB-dependent receptor n=1 Tax=Antarcticibacterium arcticum TaxID=2585771 RepID=A0A5B8YI57_9FLAO|nr:outer membrane beta-barrel family protein [Antarcticibacterium arcticum]QED37630.1 TonB-dependent receptor [Antarcticibacterium arcticum]